MARRIECAPSWGEDRAESCGARPELAGPYLTVLSADAGAAAWGARSEAAFGRVRASAPDEGGSAAVGSREDTPERSVVARSEIRSRGGSGVGARAALLLLLLQGGTHACGLLPASWGAFLGGHRSLLSVLDGFRWSGRPRRGQLDRNATDPAGRRSRDPASGPSRSRRPARSPLMSAWRASSGLPSSQTGKAMSISAAFRSPALTRPRPPRDSPGGRSIVDDRGRPVRRPPRSEDLEVPAVRHGRGGLLRVLGDVRDERLGRQEE